MKKGSSPLTRGKRPTRQPRPPVRGLIPAHAGKTSLGGRRGAGAGAHPRSRGENMAPAQSIRDVPGSSPLTRGKPPAAGHVVSRGRLIPAHAGKTDARVGVNGGDGAHPRSRGENLIDRGGNAIETGSSPLTRGKPAAQAFRS